MGVAKYKSTGDMLVESSTELTGEYRKKLDSEGEEDTGDEDAGGSCLGFYHDYEQNVELANQRPLLKKRKQQHADHEKLNHSCKFLANLQQQQHRREQPETEERNWSKHWKSAGDFLALSVQQQQLDSKQVKKQQQLSHKQLGLATAHNSSGGSLDQKGPEAQVAAATSRNNNKRIGGGKWIREKGVRHRKAAAKIRLASLSLSSPAIAQRQLKQQPPLVRREETYLKTELNVEDPELQQVVVVSGGERHYQEQQLGQQSMVECGKLEGQNNDGTCLNVDARGTMPVAQPMDHNYEHQLSHCFIDVAHLKLQQQLQRQEPLRQPQQQLASDPQAGQLGQQTPVTNGGRFSNCCYDNDDTTRQDTSHHSDCVTNDNGHGTTEASGLSLQARGVGSAGCRTIEATTTTAHGGRISATAEAAQNANACYSVSERPNWHSRQLKQRLELATSADPDYAPTRQQVATGNPLKVEKNHLSQPKLQVGICINQQAPGRPELVTRENCLSLVEHSNNSRSSNTATQEKLMGSCCESWRYALQPSKSGTYKVAQHQQQVAPISGTTRNLETQATTTAGRPLQQQQQQQQVTSCHQHGQQRSLPIDVVANRITERNKIATRHSRPGRSPISLQRLTNARLAKHRLKIQQQRQEQLALLAIRERRQQLGQFNYQQSQNREENTSLEQDNRGEQGAIFLVNGLFDRLTPYGTSNKTTSQRYNRPQGQSSTSSIHHHQQQPVIIPSTRIEICDNQPACSSGSSTRTSPNPYHSLIVKNNQRLSGDVIVYKSINMLRNSSLDPNSHHRHLASGGDRRPSDEELEDNDGGIESDPDTISSSSESTLSLNKPFCKVCHIGATKNGDKLISPCRCSGTMQYIHCGCLLKWLEISNRSNEKPMSCELCAHEYTWHKKFNYKQMGWPRCSKKDAILHLIFLAAIGIMLFSALSPMLHKKSFDITIPKGTLTTPPAGSLTTDQSSKSQQTVAAGKPSYHPHTTTSRSKNSTGHLADDEKFMLQCAAAFFISFFVAIYVQTKARDTLYGLIIKFISMNQTFYITEYDHGQLNNASSNNNNGGSSGSKQHYVEESSRGLDRKSSAQKS